MSSKILVLGDIYGHLQSTFTKVSSLHAKNHFSLAIVAGNLFAEDETAVDELLGGKISIPLPTYFTVGTTALPQRIICENLHYLGKRSTTKTSEGIKIVTLGGKLDETVVAGLSKEQYLPYHTVGDAKALHGANSADILLTTCWPTSIRIGSKVVVPVGDVAPPTGLEHVADLCAALKPRYHFSTTPTFFYEREPFFFNASQDSPDYKPVTRFISLAAHGPKSNPKWLYAFTLQTKPDPLAVLPAGCTASPFTARSKKRSALDPSPYSRYAPHDNGYHNKRQRRAPPGPGQCYFCLSNPNLETHLISSIGDDAYVTIAKGPLTTSTTYAEHGINHPGHALIIPLTHSQTLALIPKEDNAKEKTFAEMTKFKEAMQTMIARDSGNKLGAVTYEISKISGVHTHWQFIPIPAETISKGLVEAAFQVEAENLKYPPLEVRDPGIGENEGDFFRVWIWSPPTDEQPNGNTKCLTLPFDDNVRFSLQFGRVVLAKLLGLEKRIQWKDNVQSDEEEKKDGEAFKAAFKDFDFTL
ncbi:probable meiotically up-regulated gene 161 protein [Rhynchosporium graminicola]|uniref:Probable meiotically up-regulated gene 161 protein n=1 Tax=Rhynchosporium graminicola TaxID=2792576 RepID=A0A1E1KXF5_9HELO|nr:probable meiotically up-regulated gene 161 protein [Rhynchosporium commune]